MLTFFQMWKIVLISFEFFIIMRNNIYNITFYSYKIANLVENGTIFSKFKQFQISSSIVNSNKFIYFVEINMQRFCTNQSLVWNVKNQNIFTRFFKIKIYSFNYVNEIITCAIFNITFLISNYCPFSPYVFNI